MDPILPTALPELSQTFTALCLQTQQENLIPLLRFLENSILSLHMNLATDSFRFRYPKVPRGSSAEAARTLPAHVPDRIQQHTADSKQKYFVACCLPNVSLELGH